MIVSFYWLAHLNSLQEFDGSDAGAKPDEAISWGKIKPAAQPVKLYCEVNLQPEYMHPCLFCLGCCFVDCVHHLQILYLIVFSPTSF